MSRCFSKAASCVHENCGQRSTFDVMHVLYDLYVARAARPRHITSVTWAPKPPAADRGDVIVIAGLEFGGDSNPRRIAGLLPQELRRRGWASTARGCPVLAGAVPSKRLARKGNLSGLHGDPVSLQHDVTFFC